MSTIENENPNGMQRAVVSGANVLHLLFIQLLCTRVYELKPRQSNICPFFIIWMSFIGKTHLVPSY